MFQKLALLLNTTVLEEKISHTPHFSSFFPRQVGETCRQYREVSPFLFFSFTIIDLVFVFNRVEKFE